MPRPRSEPSIIDDLKTWGPPHVTVNQLAIYWMVHPFTVHRWLRDGELKGMRFRGAWRIRTDDARLYELKLFAPRQRSA